MPQNSLSHTASVGSQDSKWSKREMIKRTISRKQTDVSLRSELFVAASDQTTNPDHFDPNSNYFVGTNFDGLTTGFKRTEPPTLSKAPNRRGAGERTIATDSGVFRRHGFHNQLTDGNSSLNPQKNVLVDRPRPDYVDGTCDSLFDRAVLCWPNLRFVGVRRWDPIGRKYLDEFPRRTLKSINTYAADLAKALIAYDLAKERSYHDEKYPQATKLRPIATFIPNREEFLILEQACNKAKIAMVPVYPSLGIDACKAIFLEVEPTSLVTDFSALRKLTSSPAAKAGAWGIETIIMVDSVDTEPTKPELAHFIEGSQENEDLKRMLAALHCKSCIRFSDLIALGGSIDDVTKYTGRERPPYVKSDTYYLNQSFAVTPEASQLYKNSSFYSVFKSAISKEQKRITFDQAVPDDVQTICYTSGTTGLPKGVLITHRNLTSVAASGMTGCFQTKGMEYGIKTEGPLVTDSPDSTFSMLPLVHIFERSMLNFNYGMGIAVDIFTGKPTELLNELKISEPTILVGVPRIFQKILAGVDEIVANKGGMVQSVYKAGLSGKMHYAENGEGFTHRLWDNLAFNKIKGQICGGKLKTILSGAAPLAPSTQWKCESLFSAFMVEGYGLTECTGCCAVRLAGDSKDSVGTIMPCLELKLQNVPEMDLMDVRDEMKGEICLRGNSVTPGYFRRPDLNKEAFKDGWFHTGDIGQIKGGLLSIRDRFKAIFKLAQGEYVSPERVEGFLLSAIPWLEQIMVSGRSTSRFACAMAVLNPLRTEGWTGGNVTPESDAAVKAQWEAFLVTSKDEISRRFMADQAANMALFDMQGYERVMEIELIPFPITDPDLVTPTMKLKRNKVRLAYEKKFNSMCDAIDAKEAAKEATQIGKK